MKTTKADHDHTLKLGPHIEAGVGFPACDSVGESFLTALTVGLKTLIRTASNADDTRWPRKTSCRSSQTLRPQLMQ